MNEIASRYAEGLYSIAVDLKKVNEWQEEVKSIVKVLKENPEFIYVLSSAFLSLKEKEEMLDKTFKSATREIINMMKLMSKNHRERYIIDALQAFNSLANASRGVKEGLLYSTERLEESLILKISKKISEVENMEVELFNVIDPNLIGGIKVVINGHIYDGSIKNHLENLKINLMK